MVKKRTEQHQPKPKGYEIALKQWPLFSFPSFFLYSRPACLLKEINFKLMTTCIVAAAKNSTRSKRGGGGRGRFWKMLEKSLKKKKMAGFLEGKFQKLSDRGVLFPDRILLNFQTSCSSPVTGVRL